MKKLLLLTLLSCSTLFATWESFFKNPFVLLSLPVISSSYCMYYAYAHYKHSDRALKQKLNCGLSLLASGATLIGVFELGRSIISDPPKK